MRGGNEGEKEEKRGISPKDIIKHSKVMSSKVHRINRKGSVCVSHAPMITQSRYCFLSAVQDGSSRVFTRESRLWSPDTRNKPK